MREMMIFCFSFQFSSCSSKVSLYRWVPTKTSDLSVKVLLRYSSLPPSLPPPSLPLLSFNHLLSSSPALTPPSSLHFHPSPHSLPLHPPSLPPFPSFTLLPILLSPSFTPSISPLSPSSPHSLLHSLPLSALPIPPPPLPSVYLEGHRQIPQFIPTLKFDQLLKEIQTFFDGYTAIVPSPKADDKPYRTAKTILFHLTEQMGPEVVLPLVCVCWLVGWLATLFVCLLVILFVCLFVCLLVCCLRNSPLSI